MAVECVVRKWGSSLGIVLPKEFVDEKKLKAKDKVLVHIAQKANLSDLFGSIKTDKTGQEFKDFVRAGWD